MKKTIIRVCTLVFTAALLGGTAYAKGILPSPGITNGHGPVTIGEIVLVQQSK